MAKITRRHLNKIIGRADDVFDEELELAMKECEVTVEPTGVVPNLMLVTMWRCMIRALGFPSLPVVIGRSTAFIKPGGRADEDPPVL